VPQNPSLNQQRQVSPLKPPPSRVTIAPGPFGHIAPPSHLFGGFSHVAPPSNLQTWNGNRNSLSQTILPITHKLPQDVEPREAMVKAPTDTSIAEARARVLESQRKRRAEGDSAARLQLPVQAEDSAPRMVAPANSGDSAINVKKELQKPGSVETNDSQFKAEGSVPMPVRPEVYKPTCPLCKGKHPSTTFS
jgi:hypothetical protein